MELIPGMHGSLNIQKEINALGAGGLHLQS
jgi:hypothetical protein